MSIQDLASFIEKSPLFEKYRLHDTELVIDGDSISRQLYVIHSTYQNASFESNYDTFEDYVDSFFEMLADCHIIPYVVFEGGVRSDQIKLKKLFDRLDHVKDITNNLSSEKVYFPLFMRDVFENTVKKWKIKAVRCDFESYPTVVSIAKSLNCPVLSNESEYFICSEITYIPFRTLSTTGKKPYPCCIRSTVRDEPVTPYVPCGKFDVNTFLKYLRLTHDKLPLLGVMFGTDDSEYPNYKYLWPVQLSFKELLGRVASWISKRSIGNAIDHILILAENKISKIELLQKYESFRCFKSKYLADLEICSSAVFPEKKARDLENENDGLVREIPKIFLENFRKCRYSPYLMDMYIQNHYYGLEPQVENLNMLHSHIFSEKIVSAIHKILTNSSERLTCFVREGDNIHRKNISRCELDVPSLIEIQEMDVETRQSVILKILGLDSIRDGIQELPESCQLFVITILYLQKLPSLLTLPLSYSFVLCKIILSYVDSKNHRLFRCDDKKFNHNYMSKRKSNLSSPKKNELKCTMQISQEMKIFKEYFQITEDLRMSSDINLLHGMSQIQSCLLHIKLLNDLLNMPFAHFLIADCFNGSFIYHFCKKLEQSTDIVDFINISLKQKAPNIIDEFLTVIRKIADLK